MDSENEDFMDMALPPEPGMDYDEYQGVQQQYLMMSDGSTMLMPETAPASDDEDIPVQIGYALSWSIL